MKMSKRIKIDQKNTDIYQSIAEKLLIKITPKSLSYSNIAYRARHRYPVVLSN